MWRDTGIKRVKNRTVRAGHRTRGNKLVHLHAHDREPEVQVETCEAVQGPLPALPETKGGLIEL